MSDKPRRDQQDRPDEGAGPDQAGPPGAGDVPALLAAAEATAKENWDLFLRARADLENYRRRTERDIELMVRRGKRDLVMRVLEVADALERAAAYEQQNSADPAGAAGGSAGVSLILRQLLKILAGEGVQPIESAGQPFDPAFHEAVDVRADAGVTVPTVAEELQKGYLYEGEVIRPARVRVAQPTT